MPARISINGLAAVLNVRLAYSDMYMADISPMGTATVMAIPDISSVPTSTGTAPKAPDDPTWSARIAVCGLHCKPNRNSVTGVT